MKISEKWLHEWVPVSWTCQELGDALTMAGLEVEAITTEANFAGHIIDLSITPNRGDCLSVRGLAIEVSALSEVPLREPMIPEAQPKHSLTRTVTIDSPSDCPHYVGRIISGIDNNAKTPAWMQQRLMNSDINCINAVVDVMNYCMLELGQPMHAFDVGRIFGGIHVRSAMPAEELVLLDGQTVKLKSDTLVISDDEKPLAIAGVMGGLDSSVTLLTHDIFLESAYFSPKAIAMAARQYGLNSDSSYRFMRGIDPEIQTKAIHRATELLLSIVGGQPGPLIEKMMKENIPQAITLTLSTVKLEKLLGLTIPAEEAQAILQRLGFGVKPVAGGFAVTVPPRRSDISIEADLIEEVARLYGYAKLPAKPTHSSLQTYAAPEQSVRLSTLRKTFCDLGYQEVVTYSFVDKALQALFNPERVPLALVNPMTADMAVMRTSLWPGLVNTLIYNQRRQQPRVRIFESGLRFLPEARQLIQQQVMSGLVSGSLYPEQWGNVTREVDFFDLKGDLHHVLQLTYAMDTFVYQPIEHVALHPGQSAGIYRQGQLVGVVGALHPELKQKLDVQGNVFLFEIILEPLMAGVVPQATAISKFPAIRRDIAIVIDRSVPSTAIRDVIKETAGELLQDVSIFDVYQGKGIADDRKSIALSLILQLFSRTLIDEEVTLLMERVVSVLKEKFAAELRG